MNDLIILITTIKIALLAIAISSPFAFIVAIYITRNENILKSILDFLINLPIVLPPVVIGYGLLYLLSPNYIIGSFLSNVFQTTISFTWIAASLASMIVAFPLMVRTMEVALSNVDKNLETTARTLGANKIYAFMTITARLSYKGLLAALIIGFARSVGEFGATMVVAGNIPGKTQTLSTGIFQRLSIFDDSGAIRLILFSLIISIISLILFRLFTRRTKEDH